MKYYDEGDSSDFFACSANCPKMMARGQEIQKLNEKIREYKDKIKALYAEIRQDNIDIDDWKDTADTLAKRVEELEDDNKKLESLKQHLINHVSNKEAVIVNLKEANEKLERKNKSLNELVAPTKVLLIFHDDANQFELFCNDREISDHVYGALTQAERRIEELRVENEKLKRENEFIKLRDGFVRFENQIDELKKSNDEFEEALDRMREENEKLKKDCNFYAGVADARGEENARLRKSLNGVNTSDSTRESIVISYPKGKKISNVELYFQEENNNA